MWALQFVFVAQAHMNLERTLLSVTPITYGSNLDRPPLLDYDVTAPVDLDSDVVSLHEDAIFGR